MTSNTSRPIATRESAEYAKAPDFIWGVGTGDPTTLIGVAAVLLVVATAATLRILRLDPAATLRHE